MTLRPVFLASLVIAGCGDGSPPADAWGNFEATETTISSEVAGRLLAFGVEAGDRLAAGEMVGLVDTTRLDLQRRQLVATRSAVRTRLAGVDAQIAVLQEQRRVAHVERDRVVRLLADGAVPEKQLDDLDGQLAVLDRQIEAARTQIASIRAEAATVETQIEQVEDLIGRSTLVNPVAGTVIADFVEPQELVSVAKPLYRIASLDTLTLRAYVSGSQLPSVRLGQPVEVIVDEAGGGLAQLGGIVTWIASEAEFTPKLIQTREERVNLVYAIKVRVPNPEGRLKIGMPGEVRLEPGASR